MKNVSLIIADEAAAFPETIKKAKLSFSSPFCTHLSCHRAETSVEVISTGKEETTFKLFYSPQFSSPELFRLLFDWKDFLHRHFPFVTAMLTNLSRARDRKWKSYLIKDFLAYLFLGLVF